MTAIAGYIISAVDYLAVVWSLSLLRLSHSLKKHNFAEKRIRNKRERESKGEKGRERERKGEKGREREREGERVRERGRAIIQKLKSFFCEKTEGCEMAKSMTQKIKLFPHQKSKVAKKYSA